MKRFAYMADRLCLLAMALYALNRWLVKPGLSGGFLHDHFNDVLLIPAALPWVLWIHRRLGWRQNDRAPTAAEIALHVIVWALVCEGIGPHFLHHGTADPGDVWAYAVGAMCAWGWWQLDRIARRPACA